MKRLILILLLNITFTGFSQTVQIGSNPANGLSVKVGDAIMISGGKILSGLKLPNAIPDNAYYLSPNGTGNFTKSMIENLVLNGEKYIVFDADTLKVDYADENHLIGDVNYYIDLELVGTEESPIVLDFRNVYIDCFPDETDLLKKSGVFSIRNSENVILYFGRVEGDKYKRALDTDDEISFEHSYFITHNSGTKNLTINAGDMQGFMGDGVTASPFGSENIDNNPLGNNYFTVGSNRYESDYYTINPSLYADFGLTGGLGFNRLLKYDMEDVTFKFFDSSNTQIAEITNAQYFERYTFPYVVGIVKMKVNVKAMDGRTQSPTNFGHNLQYNPNNGSTIQNTKFADNHRGSISNIGANATIKDCEFTSNARYFSVPEFGNLTTTFSTRYQFNAEDVLSRNLLFDNNIVQDKFNKFLLISNINADITNNIFSGSGNNIGINKLLIGTVSGNTFGTGQVDGGYGTNKSTVTISNNTGTPDIVLSNGAIWINNNFSNGNIGGKGKITSTTLTDYNFSNLDFTKEIHTNNFVGYTGVSGLQADDYIYKNNFTNVSFRIAENGLITDKVILDSLVVDNRTNNDLYVIDRFNTPMMVVAKNTTFQGAKFRHATINEATNYAEASYYFENCTFTDIEDYLFKVEINVAGTVPVKYYLKNCTLTGTGDFITKTYGTGLYEIVLDNCTVGGGITLPTYVTTTVTIPTIVEPRTQPIPVITRNTGEGRTEIETIFHIMQLKIRNKTTSEIILDEDVCSTYLHYNATPSNFEYSIDGGIYWDELP